MNILALDSASKTCSACALNTETGQYALYFSDAESNHSVTLLPAARRALEDLRLTVADLDRIAVTVGPGSFTGMKIGVSAVKGLAFPHNTPCVAVSPLEALAEEARHTDGTVAALLDARRNQFYNAMFTVENGVLRRCTPDRQIRADELAKEIRGTVRLVGDGAPLFARFCEEQNLPAVREENADRISALAVARLAQNATTVSAEALAPVYLRPSQAERIRLGLPD